MKKGLSIKLSRGYKCELSKENVFATQRRIEILVKEVKRALIHSLKDYLDRVLEVYAHLN